MALAQEELQSELSAVVQSGDMQRKEQVELKVPCAAKLKIYRKIMENYNIYGMYCISQQNAEPAASHTYSTCLQ